MHHRRVVTIGLAGLLPALLANAEHDPDKFASIPQRNAFGLLKTTVTMLREPVRAPPPVHVQLTGIITFTFPKKAIFRIQEQGKPPESKVIAENQRDGSIEVREINEVAGTVRILNHDIEMVLSFDKDGIAPAGPGKAAPILHR